MIENNPRSRLRLFIDNFALAATFFLFAGLLWSVKQDQIAPLPLIDWHLPLSFFRVCAIIWGFLSLAFAFLTLIPRRANQLQQWLDHSDSKPSRFFWNVYWVILWLSLTLTFIAGLSDTSKRITDIWAPFYYLAGVAFYLYIVVALIINAAKMPWRREWSLDSILSKIGRSLNWLREVSNFSSFIFLLLVIGVPGWFIIRGSLFGGSLTSSQYLLSALAQTQGAIIAIVISLTIFAVQVSSQSYSLRSTSTLLKYRFFWWLLLYYGVSIIYDFVLLGMVKDTNVATTDFTFWINAGIFGASIALWLLFPYSKKTIEMLRPRTILNLISKDILTTKKGVFDSQRMEAIFPIFDVAKKAVKADDLATSRDSIIKIEETCSAILTENLSEEHETNATVYFAEQLQKTAKIAFFQNDIDTVAQIAKSLARIANLVTDKQLSIGRSTVVATIAKKLEDIGRSAIEKGLEWEDVLETLTKSLSNLSVKCINWKTPGHYVSNRLSIEVIEDSSIAVIEILSELNLEAMRKDVLLAARCTKRPLMCACVRLIDSKLRIRVYEQMCIKILPLVRTQDIFGVNFNWLPHIADILTTLGTESAEILGNGFPASSFKEYLVHAIAIKPSEQLKDTQATFGTPPEEIIRGAISYVFRSNISDPVAIWLIEAFKDIGEEYNRKGFSSLAEKAIEEIEFIGSPNFENKQLQKALGAIASVARSNGESRIWEKAFKTSLRILIETDDSQAKKEVLHMFEDKSNSIEITQYSVFEKMIDKCINEFKSENKGSLDASTEKRTRLDQFVG